MPQGLAVRAMAFKRWKWWAWGIATALVLTAVLGGGFAWLSQQLPDPWLAARQALASQTAQQLQADAVSLEQRVLLALQPAAQKRAVAITQQQANAWLRVRLRLWLEHLGIDARGWWRQDAGDPVVVMQKDKLTVAWPLPGNGAPRIITLTAALEARQGETIARLSRVTLGRAPMPAAGWFLRHAVPTNPSSVAPILALIEGLRLNGLVINDGQWTGGQQVRIVDVNVRESVLTAILDSQDR